MILIYNLFQLLRSIVRYPKLSDDLQLGQRYKGAMQRIMRETDK